MKVIRRLDQLLSQSLECIILLGFWEENNEVFNESTFRAAPVALAIQSFLRCTFHRPVSYLLT